MPDNIPQESISPCEEMIERVADALQAATFGYSLQLTRLVDGESTYTLTFDDVHGSVPIEFPDIDEAYAFVADKKRRTQAIAAIEAILSDKGDMDSNLRAFADRKSV